MTLLGLLAGWPQIGRAAVIEYDYTGVITSADPSTGIAVGTPFSGYFAYDPSAVAPGGNQFPGTNQYEYPFQTYGALDNGTGLTLEIGGKTFAASDGTMAIRMNVFAMPLDPGPNPSNYVVQSFMFDGYPLVHLVFTDPNPTAYPTTDVPTIFSLNNFSSANLALVSGFDDYGNEVDELQGKIETLTVGPIHAPEPSTVVVLGAAVLAFAVRSRSRRAGSMRDR